MGDPNSEKITKEMEEVQSLIQYCKRQYDGNPRGEIEARMATHELYGLLRYEADLLLEAGIKPWDGRVWVSYELLKISLIMRAPISQLIGMIGLSTSGQG